MDSRSHNRAAWDKQVENGNQWTIPASAEVIEFVFGTGAYADRSAENGPKLILLNLKLPKVDGLDVLRHIREDQRTRTIPVVILTSSRGERDLVESNQILDSFQVGVNSYIVKPVDFEQFTMAVQQLGLYWMLLNERPPQRDIS